ncbi:putative baseplate assembly protein [Micromonospora sp. NPDC006766]|uniref:putative baseplate assembly protein n=1 Tax=Micromonospora sp. NPDC006766 TaxID=3154778 RepID=UPI0033FC3D15
MPDPASLFDDRRFPDLVREARERATRRLAARGTRRALTADEDALLVATAETVDQLHARLRELGDRLRRPLLELIGVRPCARRAATAHVTFRFARPLPERLDIPLGTRVATDPTGAVTFATTRAVGVIPARVEHLIRGPVTEAPPGTDRLLVGLDTEGAGRLLAIRVVGGAVGARPGEWWEYWHGAGWRPCRHWAADGPGTLVEVPPAHVHSTIQGRRAAWLRWSVPASDGLADVAEVHADTLGVTVGAVHATRVADEPLGVSDGTPGQCFRLRHRPVRVDAAADPVVETGDEDGWVPWTVVADFAGSTPDNQHVVVNDADGTVCFGPLIREPDGTYRRYGAAPPAGTVVRIRGYWYGGGTAGNVAAGALRTPLGPGLPPGVRVENRFPARGGHDGETEEDAWRRAPLALRTRERAVTAADFEYLARLAHPDVARAHCVPGPGDWAVRVLIVPDPMPERRPRPSIADLTPAPRMLEAVTAHLEPRRLLGVRVTIEPPDYAGVAVVADLVAEPDADPRAVHAAAEEELYRFLHPLTGGYDGTGWRLGHPVRDRAVAERLEQLPQIRLARRVELHPVDLTSAARGAPQPEIALVPTALPVSVDHLVRVSNA